MVKWGRSEGTIGHDNLYVVPVYHGHPNWACFVIARGRKTGISWTISIAYIIGSYTRSSVGRALTPPWFSLAVNDLEWSRYNLQLSSHICGQGHVDGEDGSRWGGGWSKGVSYWTPLAGQSSVPAAISQRKNESTTHHPDSWSFLFRPSFICFRPENEWGTFETSDILSLPRFMSDRLLSCQ